MNMENIKNFDEKNLVEAKKQVIEAKNCKQIIEAKIVYAELIDRKEELELQIREATEELTLVNANLAKFTKRKK